MIDFVEKDSSVAAMFRFIIFRLEILPASEFRMDIFLVATVQEL